MAGSGGAGGIGGPRPTVLSGARVDTSKGSEKTATAGKAEKKNLGGAAGAEKQEAATRAQTSGAQKDWFEPAKAQRMGQLLAPPKTEPVPVARLAAQVQQAVVGPSAQTSQAAAAGPGTAQDPAWDNVGAALADAAARGTVDSKATGAGAKRSPTSATVESLSARGQAAVDATVGHLKKNDLAGAKTAFEGIEGKTGIPVDINAIVQWVVRDAYLEGSQDLKNHAKKAHVINEAKKELRGQLQSAKGAGNEARIKELDEQLSSLGDDAQLANIDVQNWLNKMQQTLQTMSNVSKLLHDTALGVIRKID